MAFMVMSWNTATALLLLGLRQVDIPPSAVAKASRHERTAADVCKYAKSIIGPVRPKESSVAAFKLFQGNWFLHNEEIPRPTQAECEFVAAAVGPKPAPWDGKPDLPAMEAVLQAHPDVLDRLGAHLLTVLIGMRGCGAAVKFLLDRGTALNVDETAYNPLHEAAWAGSVDTLEAVFESGAADATGVAQNKPHAGWPDNLSLMYWAAWGGYPKLAELLIRHGVGMHHELPIKGNGERGNTSLHEALAPSPWSDSNPARDEEKRQVAHILIGDGARYDIYGACALNDARHLQDILQEGSSDPMQTDGYGMTPLHWASRADATDCMELLLNHAVDVNAGNKARRTPLQLAAEHDCAKAIRLLAAQGADIDTQDAKGRTPLHRATYEGRVAAAEELLQAGADTTLRNKRGKTAFQLARKDAIYLRARA